MRIPPVPQPDRPKAKHVHSFDTPFQVAQVALSHAYAPIQVIGQVRVDANVEHELIRHIPTARPRNLISGRGALRPPPTTRSSQ